MRRQKTWEDVPSADFPGFRAAVRRPGVELAEAVGRFETPFEYLKPVIGGFDDMTRFLLNKVLDSDPDALAVRDWRINVMRHRYLGDPLLEPFDRHSDELDRSGKFFTTNWDECQAFRRHYYPWIFPVETDRPELRFQPNPDTDALLDYYVCEQLADYGFTTKSRRSRKSYWRCHSPLLSRRMTIDFDKGSMTFTQMTGSMRIDSLSYEVSLADPFFFSGCSFEISQLDDVTVQTERFFSEYIRIFPHVIKSLEEAISAADDFLATMTKTSSS